MSSVMPAAPAIAPVLFDVPATQTPSLPANFWALLLAPVTEPELVEAVPTPLPDIKVASPQQIARAVIRSMLTPVSAAEAPEPDIVNIVPTVPKQAVVAHKLDEASSQKNPKDDTSPEPPVGPKLMLVGLTQPQIPIPPVADPPAAPVSRQEVSSQRCSPRLPDVEAVASKNATKDPVAFELRLTPVTKDTPEPKSPLPLSDKRGAVVPVQSVSAAAPVRPQLKRRDETLAPPPSPATKGAPVFAELPLAPIQRGSQMETAIRPSVAESLAAPTPIDVPKHEPAATHVQEIAMRVSAPDSQPIDVRVSERRGEVHVSVYTPDSNLRTSLQGDLGSLVGKLEDAGFRTEARIPEISAHPLTTHSTADLSGSRSYGERQDPRGDSNGRWTSSDSRQPGDRQQQQQQPHRRATRAWEEMMEDMQ